MADRADPAVQRRDFDRPDDQLRITTSALEYPEVRVAISRRPLCEYCGRVFQAQPHHVCAPGRDTHLEHLRRFGSKCSSRGGGTVPQCTARKRGEIRTAE